MSDLTKYTDPEAHRLIFLAADLRARKMLYDRVMPEFDAKNWRGCACLWHAMIYLAEMTIRASFRRRHAYIVWFPLFYAGIGWRGR